MIDVFSETVEFIQQVSQCEMILSSSLHGLITADALKIPNRWIKLSDKIRGNDYKFADYYSAFGLKNIRPNHLDSTYKISSYNEVYESWQRPGLEQIKQELLEAFPLL